MKKILPLSMFSLALLALSSCSMPIETAPKNTRAVVEPSGTTDVSKPWNNVTKQEGDATLGIFGGMEQR